MEHHAKEPVVEEQQQRRAAIPPRPTRHPASGLPNHSVQALLGEGRPLDPDVRAQLEARLGADLGNVRVHTGTVAAASADALAARAYTFGRDVVFGPGEYRPHTPDGRALLVHELTHVQQQAIGGPIPAGSPDAEPDAAATATGAAPASAVTGTAPGIARQAKPGAPEPAAEPNDSLGGVGDVVVELASHQLAGSGLQQQMLAAAMRGFVAELRRQLKPGDQIARFRSSLKELAVPANLASFVGGYAGGAAAGFVSPVTDLLGLGALVEQLPTIAVNLGRRAWNQASALAAEARELGKNIAEFEAVARAKIAELLKDPVQLYLLLQSAGPRAVSAAGEAGRTAAHQIVGFFSGKDEEQAEKPDESIMHALTATTVEERSGVLSFLTSKATRVRKVVFNTPWSKFGYDVGHAVGAVISNLLLLIFSEGIGNAIAKIGAWLGEVAPMLARGAKGLVSLGRTIETIEKAIGALVSRGLKLIKPLEAIVAPFFRIMERLQGFLRRLFGVAEREGAALVARGGAAVAEETGARTLRPPSAVTEEAGARVAQPPSAAAEVSPANVVPLKGAKRPPVSELTKAQQAGLSRAPKGSRSASSIRGGEAPTPPAAHAQPVPDAVPIEEHVPLGRTGTDDVVSAGGAPEAPKAMAGGSRGRPPSGPRTPPPQTTTGPSAPKGASGAGSPPKVVRPTRVPPKPRPPVRGATAEGAGGEFSYGYHDPVPPTPVQKVRPGAKPVPRQAEPVRPAEAARPAEAGERVSRQEEIQEEVFGPANQAASEEGRLVGDAEQEAATDAVISPTPNQRVRPSYRPSEELAEAMRLKGNPRPPGHETHHIVADRDPRAAEARRILRSVGIEPRNNPVNGIHLPRTSMDPRTIPEAFSRHPTIHTDAYYENVNKRLRDAAAGRLPPGPGQVRILDRRARIEAELEKLYDEIVNNKLPHPKKRD